MRALPLTNHILVGTSDADLACHHLGDEGTDAVAEAPAGSQIVFQWVYVSCLVMLESAYSYTIPGVLCSGLAVRFASLWPGSCAVSLTMDAA